MQQHNHQRLEEDNVAHHTPLPDQIEQAQSLHELKRRLPTTPVDGDEDDGEDQVRFYPSAIHKTRSIESDERELFQRRRKMARRSNAAPTPHEDASTESTEEEEKILQNLEVYLRELAPKLSFRLLGTKKRHDLSFFAPYLISLGYETRQDIEYLEVRDMPGLVNALRQTYDEEKPENSRGIGSYDWFRIQQRLTEALRDE